MIAIPASPEPSCWRNGVLECWSDGIGLNMWVNMIKYSNTPNTSRGFMKDSIAAFGFNAYPIHSIGEKYPEGISAISHGLNKVIPMEILA